MTVVFFLVFILVLKLCYTFFLYMMLFFSFEEAGDNTKIIFFFCFFKKNPLILLGNYQEFLIIKVLY